MKRLAFILTLCAFITSNHSLAQSYEAKEITLHCTYLQFSDGEQVDMEGRYNTVWILRDNYILWGQVEGNDFDIEGGYEMKIMDMYSITESFSVGLTFIGSCTTLDKSEWTFGFDFGKKQLLLMKKGSEMGIRGAFEEYQIIDK